VSGSNSILQSPAGSDEDRRCEPRRKFIAQAVLFPDNGDSAPQKIELRNISTRGCSFQLHGDIDTARRYRIKIDMGPMGYTSRLRIASVRADGPGNVTVGAEFVLLDTQPAHESAVVATWSSRYINDPIRIAI
jgi:hypothetical protein